MIKEIIQAAEQLTKAADNYYEKHPGLRESMPESPESLAAWQQLEGAIVKARVNFHLHLEKTGEAYEATKTAITNLQADILSGQGLNESAGKIPVILTGLRDLRDLACVQYDEETWNAMKELKS